MNENTVDWVIPIIGDEAAVQVLVEGNHYPSTKATRIVIAWRRMAKEHDYNGPTLWQVRAGFTLKCHAPAYGPCGENFQYLQDWQFDDTPTTGGLVFWIPRFLNKRLLRSKKNKDERLGLMHDVRHEFGLPEHHLTQFGSVTLLAALILGHFKASGERLPSEEEWGHTDTHLVRGGRLYLGDFCGNGLDCYWSSGPFDFYNGSFRYFLLGTVLASSQAT